ncbi:MAG: vWA domain-containing protein [Acidimicrobiales bacterium]
MAADRAGPPEAQLAGRADQANQPGQADQADQPGRADWADVEGESFAPPTRPAVPGARRSGALSRALQWKDPEPPPPPPPLDHHKIAVARLWAVQRHPYLTAALFASPVVASPGLGRVGVDSSWRLYVDPALVAAWSVEVLGSILVHHAGHLIRDHAGRARSAGVDRGSSRRWGLAAEAEINDDLIGSGLRLPDGRVTPQDLGWSPGRLAEEYFHTPTRRPDEEFEADSGSGVDGLERDWELPGEMGGGLPPGEGHLLRCQVAEAVMRYGKEGLGRLSAGWKRWAADQLAPKVDWRRVLAAEIRKGLSTVSGRADYSYRRPSRRAAACPGVILAGMERPVPEVVVICDTSGSMSPEALAGVLAEVDGVVRSVGVARNRLRVMSVDAAVQKVQRVSSGAQVDLRGGGGTDMRVGLAAVARLKPRPSVAVILTDGLTPWPAEPPKRLSVVVGLVARSATGAGPWAAPEWARVVTIDEPLAAISAASTGGRVAGPGSRR